MSVEKVKAYLAPYGVNDRIREFDVSSATVELAALAVGVEGARIAKTLSFKVGEDPILVVAAGDAKVDNSKYKHFFGAKANMLTAEEAVERIGHAVGGVCPFALPDDVKTYLDVSLKRFETVFPAVGSAASAIELTCDELERCCGKNFVQWVDVCKGWQDEERDGAHSARRGLPSGQCLRRPDTGAGPPAPCREPGERTASGGLGQRPRYTADAAGRRPL